MIFWYDNKEQFSRTNAVGWNSTSKKKFSTKFFKLENCLTNSHSYIIYIIREGFVVKYRSMIESSLHQKGDSLMLNIMIKSNVNMEKVNKCLKKIGLENF